MGMGQLHAVVGLPFVKNVEERVSNVTRVQHGFPTAFIGHHTIQNARRTKREYTSCRAKHVLQTCQSAPTAVCPGITTPSDTRLCSLWMTQSVITKWQKNTNSDTRRLLCPLQVKTPSTHPPTSRRKRQQALTTYGRSQVVLDSAVSYHLCTSIYRYY